MCFDSKRAFKVEALSVLSDIDLSSFYKEAYINIYKWSFLKNYMERVFEYSECTEFSLY